MRSKQFSQIGLLILICSSCIRNKIDPYDLKEFRKIDSTSSKLKFPEDFEVYVSKNDSNYKMVKTYYDNDSVQAIGFYFKNKKDGTWKLFSDSGRLIFSGNYHNGLKIDSHKTYNFDGSLKLVEIYDSGRILKRVDLK
jgi:antitoxin component YwqK of YwqJK toxin-antitoxin module